MGDEKERKKRERRGREGRRKRGLGQGLQPPPPPQLEAYTWKPLSKSKVIYIKKI